MEPCWPTRVASCCTALNGVYLTAGEARQQQHINVGKQLACMYRAVTQLVASADAATDGDEVGISPVSLH